jgi:hypothetical protein
LPTGVFDYAEFKKNKISVIRPRLNGARFRVFTLCISEIGSNKSVSQVVVLVLVVELGQYL